MSAEIYNALFDKKADHQGDQAWVAALAQMGRVHRAATDLANDEMMEGTWVYEEQEDIQQMRYAADDREEQRASYTGGVYQVDIALGASGFEATQVAGPAGASLKIDGQWVVLTPGETVSIPIDALLESVLLVDLAGQEVELRR